MGPSDLTNDLGVLSPATAVDAADRRSPHPQPEAERKRRQQGRAEGDEDNENPDDLAMEDGHDTPHLLDHLA